MSIKIEDLEVKEELTTDEMDAVFGGKKFHHHHEDHYDPIDEEHYSGAWI